VELIKVGHNSHYCLLVVSDINQRLAVSVNSGHYKIVGWLEAARVLKSTNNNCR
jgi:hypothetical protein